MSTKGRQRHNPEQIVRKLRDADAMLNAGKELVRPSPLVFMHSWEPAFLGAAFFGEKMTIVHNKQVVFETISTHSLLEAKLPAILQANLPPP
jgi:hypothetical protein